MYSSIRRRKRRNEWVGHILGLIIEGRVEGSNCRVRRRLKYIQQTVKDQEYYSYVKMKRKASNREEWRVVANQSQD